MQDTTVSKMIKALPEKEVALAQAEALAFQTMAWALGDRVEKWWDIFARQFHWAIVRKDVHRALSAVTGLSTSTLNYYDQLASFFPPGVRKEYMPPLLMAHFEVARRFGERWKEVLDGALWEMSMNGGKPPSAAWLETFFSTSNETQRKVEEQAKETGDFIEGRAHELSVEIESPVVEEETEEEKKDRLYVGVVVFMAQSLIKLKRFLESATGFVDGESEAYKATVQAMLAVEVALEALKEETRQ